MELLYFELDRECDGSECLEDAGQFRVGDTLLHVNDTFRLY